ncbi:hypothetical protein UFOVP824_11 [uncultured Caudovirales phage]|uniref:Ubiquitin-activating enzyme E1, FCCH domain containing protein n=1 Tax=uncultured Caudovirales phage TaxID=2100421 RepID=A0A6J5P0T7_9CAUD|nr:hypothetical protein UFOVP824_11 [uncultured Caudovirales phage]
MPNTRLLNRSFSGGEIAPEMYGRVDDVKFQTGASTVKNFIVLPQGPLVNRPGLELVREVKTSTNATRLIPFTFNTTQTMVIELGNGYARFHTQGATLSPGSPAAYSTTKTISAIDLVNNIITSNAHGYADGTPVKVSATTTMPAGLTAGTTYYVIYYSANTYKLSATSGGTEIDITSAGAGTITTNRVYSIAELVSSGGTNYYCIAETAGNAPPNATYWYAMPAGIYEIPTPYASADLFNIHYVQSADVLTLVHPSYAPKELRRLGATTWTLSGISFGPVLNPPATVTLASSGTGVTNVIIYKYVVTALSSDEINESVASTPVQITTNLNVSGVVVNVTWTAVAGASRYNIYRLQGGIYGFIGSTTALSIYDDNIAPDMSITPATYETVFSSANNYPGAVSYYEQRRIFAGTNTEPQRLWMTKSGTESDMSYGIPIQDADRISFRVAAREANTIRHIVPLTQLILLTSAAEWRVTSVNSDALTPSSISVRPQSYVGANNVQPVIINNSLAYCAARGGHVRELGYSWQSNGFITGDLSIRASHLFDNYELVDMCYAKAPHPVLWFISTSGKLLGLTYIPEQQIGSWHQHDTDGVFESCACVSEGTEDRLYVVVKRVIGGTTKRFVERMAVRDMDAIEDCVHMDCALTYDGTNTSATTVTITQFSGTNWDSSSVLTITASAATFQYPATTDVNDCIVLTDASGNKYRLRITSTTSTTVARAVIDNQLPTALRSVATTTWSFARDSVTGLSHLNGKSVSILADGCVMSQRTVSSGSITLDRASTIVHVGLPYNSDLKTLPVTLQVDALGQGRYKNVNKAWVRVERSSGLSVGPDEDNLVQAKVRTTEAPGSPPDRKSEEILVVMNPSWGQTGEVFIRQSDPVPLSIISMTAEVAIGG